MGINPIVITLPTEMAAKIFNATIDEGLRQQVPDSVSVYRIECKAIELSKNKFANFARIFFNPTDRIANAWGSNLTDKIEQIITEYRPKAIYTSLPPFSCGNLVKKIAGRFKIPFVLDMRDLFAFWSSQPNISYFQFLLKLKMERSLFKAAYKVIGVTPQMIKKFTMTHPGININKFVLIPNGADYKFSSAAFESGAGKNKFIIGYVGSFYYDPISYETSKQNWWKRKGHRKLQYFASREDWLYRSPFFFFKTLQLVFKKKPSLRSIIKFEFIGREPAWLNDMLIAFELQDIYHCNGFVAHAEALKLQAGFDALLTTSEKIMNEDHVCLPSKLFDYLHVNKPIIGFVTSGIQKDFLLTSGAGEVCDPDNIDESAEKIIKLVSFKKSYRLNLDYLKKFTREESAKKLADIFFEI